MSNEFKQTPAPEPSLAGLIEKLIEQTRHDKHRLFVAKDGTKNLLIEDDDGSWTQFNETESGLQAMPPARKTGDFMFGDPKSFCDFYKMHDSKAPIYAQLNSSGIPTFTAVLNDHTKEAADFRDFRAIFSPDFSVEWTTWSGRNGESRKFDGPKQFAVFIQDNAPDFMQPTSADMLSIALNFRVKSDGAFNCAQRLQDGHVQLDFSHIVQASGVDSAGGTVSVPDSFVLSIPVYEMLGAKHYQLQARLNFRTNQQGVTLWYELVRPRKVLLQAFQDAWTMIAGTTKATILLGTPN